MRRSPSSESTTAHSAEGVLARPRRASQLRDSAGFTPDFASHTAPGQTREPQRSPEFASAALAVTLPTRTWKLVASFP